MTSTRVAANAMPPAGLFRLAGGILMRRLLTLAPLLALGCLNEPNSRSLSPGKPADNQVTDATRALAARVDQIGSELVAQNPFLGVTPTFMVVGRPGREIGHPDLNGVLVSEGLAAQLSDDELAGLLALELGQMSAEAKRARDYVRDRPMPTLPSGGAFDPSQTMTQALVDEQARKSVGRRNANASEPPKQIAARILESSGRKADVLNAVEPLYSAASRAPDGPSTLGGKTPPPRWTN